MNKWHLAWIIPLCLFAGMVFYSILNTSVGGDWYDLTIWCLEELYNVSVRC